MRKLTLILLTLCSCQSPKAFFKEQRRREKQFDSTWLAHKNYTTLNKNK